MIFMTKLIFEHIHTYSKIIEIFIYMKIINQS